MTTRTSSLTPAAKKDILNRLKSVRGHLDAVIAMVEADMYCVQIIKQIAACRAALDRVSRLELQNHLERCVVTQIQSGEAENAVDEIMDILNLRRGVA